MQLLDGLGRNRQLVLDDLDVREHVGRVARADDGRVHFRVSENEPQGDRDGVIGGEAPTALPPDCQHLREYWTGADLPEEARIVNDPGYTIRAWMAVISYLLMDYRFLYQ